MSEQTLKYKFDVSAYRLLGRELITDRITALFELVKNCYDANSTKVTVDFFDVNPRSDKSRVVIKDNGIGMTFADVRDKWMVIGTSSKRKSNTSPAPFNRKVTGRKGVGRFAVDKLGAKLLLKTKKANDKQKLCLETDWSAYELEEKNQLNLFSNVDQKLFTDMENRYWYEDSNDNEQGTTLDITFLNDVWTENDITRAYKELSKLIMPSLSQKYPFDIHINAPQYHEFQNRKVESLAIEKATLKVELDFDDVEKRQETLELRNNELVKIKINEPPCGFLRMTVYYYDQKAKSQFKKTTNALIDGLKVYRDGVIATPFAEYSAEQNAQKDLLGIDKRRYSGFFDKISTRDILGWIDISAERNPQIIDATNRQDFVDNEAWQELKKFVIKQISRVETYLKVKKDDVRTKTETQFTQFTDAKEDISVLRREINKIKENPEIPTEIKDNIALLDKATQKAQASLNKINKEYQDLKTEKKQQENLFFSLVSLQTYAGMLSHIMRTSLGKIKRNAEFLHKHFPDPQFNSEYPRFSAQIYDEMTRLDKAVDFMLKYAKDDQNFEDLDVKQIIENQMLAIYEDVFEKEQIKPVVEINKDLSLNYNQKAFEDILDNLIGNSIKALSNNKGEKIIKCSGIVEKEKFILYFSDNGCGIEEKDRDKIFDVFFTTTAEQGGAGLGLFIVKSRIEALNGKIELVENELKPTGTTFKIEFPFKKS